MVADFHEPITDGLTGNTNVSCKPKILSRWFNRDAVSRNEMDGKVLKESAQASSGTFKISQNFSCHRNYQNQTGYNLRSKQPKREQIKNMVNSASCFH